MSKYIPLHVHSDSSHLDSMCRVDKLVSKAKEIGFASLALTDHGNIYNHIKFYKECKKQRVKPILGIEAYFVDDRKDTTQRKAKHIILLAKNNQGLANLYKMMTIANMPIKQNGGFYYIARIDWELLEKYYKGLICMTACVGGIVPKVMIEQGYDEAKKIAKRLQNIFGADFYLEVQNVNEPDIKYISEQDIVIQMSRQMSQELGIRIVATNDIHYIHKDDSFAHEVLKAISSKKTLKDPPKVDGDKNNRGRLVFKGYDYYLKSEKEMLEKFLPEEVYISGEIAEQCNIDIPLKQRHMPQFDATKNEEETYQILLEKCREGWKKYKINKSPKVDEYTIRVKQELADIKEAGLQNYFLIVWDVMRFVQEQHIGRGYSRGSAGGSLVSFLLNITKVDPIKYGLQWERFWNKGRKGSMPDIDIDVAIDRRDEVIEYLRNKFGRSKVFPMVTLSTMSAKAAIKDVGKVLGLPFEDMNDLTKKIPHKCISIQDGISRSDYIESVSAHGEDDKVLKWQKQLKKEKESPDRTRQKIEAIEQKITERRKALIQTFQIAQKIEDCQRQRSSHACALLIADDNIFGKIPLCYDPAHHKLLTGFDMYDLEDLGYLKLDILGLKTVSVINRIQPNGTDFINEFDDERIFDFLSQGYTKGIFQLESPLGKTWLRKIRPKNLSELGDVIAIIRPAVLETGLADEYVKNKENPGAIEYLHSDLKPILDQTYGIMLYQEQMLEIVKKFAGFDLAKADLLRRACGKKLPEEMAKYESEFIEGCKNNGYEEETAKKIWEWINATADYSFNASHSIGYAMMAYATAYFKLYYPHKFFCAMLQLASNEQKPQQEIAELFYDANLLGVAIKPPMIRKKNAEFLLENNIIYYGLGHIKHIGASTLRKIVNNKSKTWEDFLKNRKEIKKDVLYALILSGALDHFGISRSTMKRQIDFLNALSEKEEEIFVGWLSGNTNIKKETKKGGEQILTFGAPCSFVNAVKNFCDFLKNKNKIMKLVNARRDDKIINLCTDYINKVNEEMGIKEKAGYEIYYLGIPATCSEVDIYEDKRKTHSCLDIARDIDGRQIGTIAIISRVVEKKDRKDNKMAFITIFDKSYMMDAVIFSQSYTAYAEILEVGKAVYIQGVKRKGSLIVNHIEVAV